MDDQAESGRIQLYVGQAHDCPYLDDRIAVNHFADPTRPLNKAIYSALMPLGFRRSGDHVYRPACPECNRCMSLRIDVEAFRPNRSQRRARNANADLHTHIAPAAYSDERFALYRKYLLARHGDGEMARCGAEDFPGFLRASWGETLFLELRKDQRLLGVAATDVLSDALSAVYTWFDPDESARGLGVHAILQQIEEARRRGLRWLYLGYWIPESRKMRYKTAYRPAEVLIDDDWRSSEDLPIELLEL